MTTTKKKAKAPTLAQRLTATNNHADYLLRQVQDALVSIASVKERVTALEDVGCVVDDIGVRITALEQEMSRLRVVLPQRDDMAFERLAALEQAQRPAEKPAAEKRAGPWVWDGDQRRRMMVTDGPTRWVARVGFVSTSGVWHAATENRGGLGTQSLVTGAMHVCDEALRADGWTLDVPPAPAPSEESRLRDAVVDAALAWAVAVPFTDKQNNANDALEHACKALRAHLAKKGGA